MSEFKKTAIFNWQNMSWESGIGYRILGFEDYNKKYEIKFYPTEKLLYKKGNLPASCFKLYCASWDKADELALSIIKANNVVLEEQYKNSRYFKLKQLLTTQ